MEVVEDLLEVEGLSSPRWWRVSQAVEGLLGGGGSPRQWRVSQAVKGLPGGGGSPRWWRVS